MNNEIKLGKDMTPRLLGDTWSDFATMKSSQKTTYGLFECQYCGKEWVTGVHSVKRGNTCSCGCLLSRDKGTLKHNLANHKLYAIWNALIQRCNNPNNSKFYMYGARGITVCEEWLDITTFIAWCEATHPNVKGVSLDRIDNDKGYSPENCRWADRTTQNINQRMRGDNTSGYTGINYHITQNKWTANIRVNTKLKHLGSFSTIKEAVQARDNYIIENGLPHKLSSEYKKEADNE